MSKLTRVPFIYIFGCILLTAIISTPVIIGLTDAESNYYKKLHPFKWNDILGLSLIFLGLIYQVYYWITTSPEKNNSKLSDDSIVLNYLGVAVSGLGFILSFI